MKKSLKQGILCVLCMMFMSYASISYAAGLKNVNTATATQLTEVKGIGTKTAAAIIEYRKKHGTIKKMDELLAVKGVGKKTLVKIERIFGVAGTKKAKK